MVEESGSSSLVAKLQYPKIDLQDYEPDNLSQRVNFENKSLNLFPEMYGLVLSLFCLDDFAACLCRVLMGLFIIWVFRIYANK